MLDDEEVRAFMAQLLAKLSSIEEKVTKLWDQTDAAGWERLQSQPQPPARVVSDEEWSELQRQRGYY